MSDSSRTVGFTCRPVEYVFHRPDFPYDVSHPLRTYPIPLLPIILSQRKRSTSPRGTQQ